MGLMAPTSPLIQMWIKTHRYLVCMKDPLLINASSPKTYKSRYNKEIKQNKDSTVNKTECRSKRNQQVNHGGPDKQPKNQAPTISSIDKSLSRNRHIV